MEFLAIVLIIYGVLLLSGLIFQFPFFYNNLKSKALINMIGRKGYNILLLVLGLGTLIAGILILS